MTAGWWQKRWYSDAPPPPWLQPLAWLYGRVADARRRQQQSRAAELPLPVIVVGNISVGGTGKTPFVIWLVKRLQAWGFRPGVVSRGYGGRAPEYPFAVEAHSLAEQCGDEPLLIRQATSVPVMVDPDRVAAVQALARTGEVDVVVSDDGLQHYRMQRELEICVVDAARGFGNGARLPAGPLRESIDRLQEIPLVVVNGQGSDLQHRGRLHMSLVPGLAASLQSGEQRPLDHWYGQSVHAVAGIGHPSRFFRMLADRGLQVVAHSFPDHHHYSLADLTFSEPHPILMTEKDAVKCQAFGLERAFAVPVEAYLSEDHTRLVQQFCAKLKG